MLVSIETVFGCRELIRLLQGKTNRVTLLSQRFNGGRVCNLIISAIFMRDVNSDLETEPLV